MIYNIKIHDGNRSDVINYITEHKKNGKFTVVDVGGSVVGWSVPYVDAIVDFNVPIKSNSTIKFFKCDITHPDSYTEIFDYVEKNGKFDFCICTHTLEDIMNPGFVCEQISKISKEGYVAFPSKYRELARIEGNYRGYIHHRWIFTVSNNKIIGYPKICYLENNFLFDAVADRSHDKRDLSFFWKDSIQITYINGNYLGPNVNAVIGYYNELLKE